MTMKAAKSVQPRAIPPSVEADERHQGDVDAFVGRNRETLNASIRRSREEVGRGVQSSRSIDDIVSDGRKRHQTG